MSELIKVKNAAYSRYEELLIKRDLYEREADSILIFYTQEFGELTAAVFETKIECIRLKKTIAYCQAYLNRGEPADMNAVQLRMQKEMAMYKAELEHMLEKNRLAREAKTVSIADAERTRKVYRRLVKKLHPDINPKTSELSELADLWRRIVIAYRKPDPGELTELEVLANKAIEELGLGRIEIDIPDIEERILLLEEEINDILTTEPYTYRIILEDSEEKEKHRAQLSAELDETGNYCLSLEEKLNEMLATGGVTLTWRMN